MQRLMKSMPVFLVAYVVLMIPTYMLPYAGSNSSLATMVGGVTLGWGGAFPPQWWAHMFFLGALVVVAWARSAGLVGKVYLPAFAFLAAVFDMAPVLRAIPFVPTLFHLLTLIMGVVGAVAKEDEVDARRPLWQQPGGVLATFAVVAIIGSGASIYSVSAGRNAVVAKSETATKAPAKVAQKPAVGKAETAPVAVVAKAPIVQPAAVVPGAAVVPATVEEKPALPAGVPQKGEVVSTPASKLEVVAETRDGAAGVANGGVGAVQARGEAKNPVAGRASAQGVQVATVASGAVADFLEEARACLKAKRYDCSMSQARAALRLEPGNQVAKRLLAKASSDQQAALDMIDIR